MMARVGASGGSALIVACLLVLGGLPAAAQNESPATDLADVVTSEAEFQDAMRKLWEDHVTWTRLYIVSAATLDDDLPDIEPTAQRLLSNQADIGAAIAPYYGEDAAERLTELLTEHISLATELISAAKDEDERDTERASDDWYANANEIAEFLSDANPEHWPLEAMQAMMTEHLDLTLEEAIAQLDGRYQRSVEAYDEVHVQILEMADMLSDGIVAQFPLRFRE